MFVEGHNHMQNAWVEIDISTIHPELDLFSHLWEGIGIDIELNAEVIVSSFELYKKGTVTPVLLREYPHPIKSRISNLIFDIKRAYMNLFYPPILIHEFKTEHSFQKMLALYQRKMGHPEYGFELRGRTLYVIRRDIIEAVRKRNHAL